MNNKKIKKNSGVTLIELIVVLAIFAVLSTVVIFNYGGFQSKIDLQNLANDVALQIVQAQNAALSGLLTSQNTPVGWKPTYGVYFSKTASPAVDNLAGANNLNFIYFADLSSPIDYQFDGLACDNSSGHECINKYTITKGNYISGITTNSGSTLANLTITFTRPSSGATFYSGGAPLSGVTYVEIAVTPPKGAPAYIQLYQVGRIQISATP